jgi:hypothetical protein
MNEHKIYLLKTHLKTENDEYLYKIGRTTQQQLIRLSDYPKTYKLILTRACIDFIYIENKIITLFTKKYKKEFKNEYFVGDENEMVNDINEIINNQQDNNSNSNNSNNNPSTTSADYSEEISACKQGSVFLHTPNQLDKIREQNKARQEKFYKSNKETINAKRRELYKLKRESLKTEK